MIPDNPAGLSTQALYLYVHIRFYIYSLAKQLANNLGLDQPAVQLESEIVT